MYVTPKLYCSWQSDNRSILCESIWPSVAEHKANLFSIHLPILGIPIPEASLLLGNRSGGEDEVCRVLDLRRHPQRLLDFRFLLPSSLPDWNPAELRSSCHHLHRYHWIWLPGRTPAHSVLLDDDRGGLCFMKQSDKKQMPALCNEFALSYWHVMKQLLVIDNSTPDDSVKA